MYQFIYGGHVLNILITQVSKMGSLCWLKCLKRIDSIDITIYGTDQSELGHSAGSLLVEHFVNIPYSPEDEQYIICISNLCKSLAIDLLLCVMDNELELFLKNHTLFTGILYGPDYECFSVFHDKYIASMKMKEIGIEIPPIITNMFDEDKVIIRDKISIGSRGIYVINLKTEAYIENRFQKNRFMQKYIQGEEYTVDVLADRNGTPVLIVPRKRLEIRQGISFMCQLIYDIDIINACKKIYSTYRIPGISNVQFIKNESGLYFIELNPRLSGTSIATVIGGFNFTELFLQHFLFQKPVMCMEEYQKLIAWDSIISRDYQEYIYLP